MTRRICPICGRSWYSSQTDGTWICECGAEIGKEHEVSLERGEEDGQAARSSDRKSEN